MSVTYGGVVIGSFSGTKSLAIILNSSATTAAVQALLRNITFLSLSATPSTATRTIKVTLTDGDGGTSNLPTKTVTISSGASALRTARTDNTLEFSDLDQAFGTSLIENDLLVS